MTAKDILGVRHSFNDDEYIEDVGQHRAVELKKLYDAFRDWEKRMGIEQPFIQHVDSEASMWFLLHMLFDGDEVRPSETYGEDEIEDEGSYISSEDDCPF